MMPLTENDSAFCWLIFFIIMSFSGTRQRRKIYLGWKTFNYLKITHRSITAASIS